MSGNGSCADNKLREGAGAHRAYASGESQRGGVTAEDAVGPLKRHPNVIPIPGAKNARQARDSAAAPSWTLSFEELTRICSSGRHGEGGFGLAETASASVPRGRWRVRQLSLAAARRRGAFEVAAPRRPRIAATPWDAFVRNAAPCFAGMPAGALVGISALAHPLWLGKIGAVAVTGRRNGGSWRAKADNRNLPHASSSDYTPWPVLQNPRR